MTGATATPPGGCRGDKFGAAFKAKCGNFFNYLFALTVRAFNFPGGAKYYFFKILFAILTMEFKYWHKHTPKLFYQKGFKIQEYCKYNTSVKKGEIYMP